MMSWVKLVETGIILGSKGFGMCSCALAIQVFLINANASNYAIYFQKMKEIRSQMKSIKSSRLIKKKKNSGPACCHMTHERPSASRWPTAL
jgi:hypothetical protein